MFDLDGTLLDTLADIAAAGNHMLASFGLPAKPVAEYRYLAGQGAPWLVEHALGPEHQHLADEGLTRLKAYQMEHGLDQTRLYDGIADLLEYLTALKLPMAVLSNKPHPATLEAVARKLDMWRFEAVEGHKPGGPLKPDPAGALAIAEATDIEPGRWLYVGDTRVDVLTAKAAGMYPIGVLWGFRDQAELAEAGAETIVANPFEISNFLEQSAIRLDTR